MREFLRQLMEQRRKLLDGLDANQGDINLDIFEDFYPDQAHFVFELLQNAEDTGATAVEFTVTEEGCWFEHNGERAFTEEDVRSITGIHSSTKKKSPDKIGKFGVGFKSVFVYTQAPTIYSGDFSFRIVQLVMPEPVPADPGLGRKTKFWLPFNNPAKRPEGAFAEIKAGLRDLAETTLLFLPNIETIKWSIKNETVGELLRVSHTEHHIEILKQIDGQTTTSAHFLRFSAPIPDLPRQNVAIAFALDFLPKVETFSGSKPLSRQMRIVEEQGQVAVFFPAAKETSGLRFHLHAPFVPELSRASIKNTPANNPLFDQLAELTASSLPTIRDLGLLTTDFLGVLPNPQDQLGVRYTCVRTAVIAAMNSQPLTPTYQKGHAPAKNLVQAKAVLKELLSPEDVEFLIDYDDDQPEWSANRALQGTMVERFMNGLAIKDWDVAQFVDHIIKKATEGGWPGIDRDFMAWLESRSIEWHQQLYALLARESDAQQRLPRLKRCKIVRLTNAAYSLGSRCHFPGDDGRAPDGVLCVDPAIYSTGKAKSLRDSAEKFLRDIEVTGIGERQLVEAILRNTYKDVSRPFKERDHLSQLRRFMKLAEQEPSCIALLSVYPILFGSDNKWHKPNEIYIDHPYFCTGLTESYRAIGIHTRLSPLSDVYERLKVDQTKFVDFCKKLGCVQYIGLSPISCRRNPEWSYLRSVPGERETSPLDSDFEIAGFSKLVETGSEQIARLVWNTMRALPDGGSGYSSAYSGYVLQARYRKSHSRGEHTRPSTLVHQLRGAAWVPQRGLGFVRPAEARAALLPEGFTFDPGWAWIKAIRFGQNVELANEKAKALVAAATERERKQQEAAKNLGFDDAETARKLAEVPADELKRFLQERQRRMSFELPDQESRNPERRAVGVTAQAAVDAGRQTEQRVRSVSVGVADVKAEAAQYLRQQYTNEEDQICQICKDVLPFKLDGGMYFFETVEFLPSLEKRHYQNYLCLCPNHSAMFRHANGSAKHLRHSIAQQAGNYCPLVLAQQDETIYFTKMHLADLQALIAADDARNEEAKSAGD